MTRRQEARSRYVNAMCILEMLDSGSDGSLELEDGGATIINLGVRDDIELHATRVHKALECLSER